MEVEAAKMIGAGLAVIALAGVGVGIGNIFSASSHQSPVTQPPEAGFRYRYSWLCPD